MANIGIILSKSIGAVGLGAVGYDVHFNAKHEGAKYGRDLKAISLQDRFENNMKADSPSIVKSKVKTELFKLHLDEHISDFFTSASGYTKGALQMLVSDIVPLGLSVGALATKGIFSKFCGAGLLAYGGIFVIKEGLGIGKMRHPHV